MAPLDSPDPPFSERLFASETPTETQILLGGPHISPLSPVLTWLDGRFPPGRKRLTVDGRKRTSEGMFHYKKILSQRPGEIVYSKPQGRPIPGKKSSRPIRGGFEPVGKQTQVFTYERLPLPCSHPGDSNTRPKF